VVGASEIICWAHDPSIQRSIDRFGPDQPTHTAQEEAAAGAKNKYNPVLFKKFTLVHDKKKHFDIKKILRYHFQEENASKRFVLNRKNR